MDESIFAQPGSLEGTDFILPRQALTPNAKADLLEEVRPAILGKERDVLISNVVLLRPVGWQAALKKAPTLRHWSDVQLVVQHLHAQDYESVVVLALDAKGKLMGIHEAATGGLHGVSIDVRQAFKVAALVGAYAAIIVHNHPSGDPTPSREDVTLTEAVIKAANAAGIYIVDHVVVAYGGGVTSLFEEAPRTFLRHPKAPPLGRDVVISASDATVSLRQTTAEGTVLRRLWGGNAKLVVRTGLVPAGGMEKIHMNSPSSVARILKNMDLAAGDVLAVCMDGKGMLRGARVLPDAKRMSEEQLLRDALGYALAVSGSTMVLGYTVGGREASTASLAANGTWLKVVADKASALLSVVDIIVQDESSWVSLHERNEMV